MSPCGKTRRTAAMTLLEVTTVVLVITILLVLAMPIYQQVQFRLERTKCMGNLRSLHVAMTLYMQDHRSWPQVPNQNVDPQDVARDWIRLLKPYNIEQASWLCPTIQRNAGGPDMTNPDNVRIDYIATPFDRQQDTPMRWATQPWFVENGDVHGNGNLLIFPDGHIVELADFISLIKKPPATKR